MPSKSFKEKIVHNPDAVTFVLWNKGLKWSEKVLWNVGWSRQAMEELKRRGFPFQFSHVDSIEARSHPIALALFDEKGPLWCSDRKRWCWLQKEPFLVEDLPRISVSTESGPSFGRIVFDDAKEQANDTAIDRKAMSPATSNTERKKQMDVIYNMAYGGFCMSEQAKRELMRRGMPEHLIRSDGYDMKFRIHPKLLALFDEMGAQWCSGRSCRLAKALLPEEDIPFVMISEYDGKESVRVDRRAQRWSQLKDLLHEDSTTLGDAKALVKEFDSAFRTISFDSSSWY